MYNNKGIRYKRGREYSWKRGREFSCEYNMASFFIYPNLSRPRLQRGWMFGCLVIMASALQTRTRIKVCNADGWMYNNKGIRYKRGREYSWKRGREFSCEYNMASFFIYPNSCSTFRAFNLSLFMFQKKDHVITKRI